MLISSFSGTALASRRLSLGISILSYDGKVFFGLMSDRRLVPDPQKIIAGFRPEFEKLVYLGMMLPLQGRPHAASADELLAQSLEE